MRDVNIKVQVCQMIFYVPERQEDTESGDGVAASGGPSICLHDPYRVCGLSARPLPGLRIVCTTLTGSADCLHDPYRVCGLSARPLPGLRIVCTALTRPALGGRADEAPRSETRDDPQGAADGHQILEQGDDEVRRAQRFYQAYAHLVAGRRPQSRPQLPA